MRTVMIFGTFDILHLGHLDLLLQAKNLGDNLVAVVARDDTVSVVKGHKSFNTEDERVAMLSHIDLVDQVILGDLVDKIKVVKDIQPDVIALGYDQESFVADLEKVKDKIEIVRLLPFHPEKNKTGKIKEYLQSLI
jgi:FAD synthetase